MKDIPVILDYCAEGEIHYANSQVEEAQDANAKMFTTSVKSIKGRLNEMISIKITGLINMPMLKALNNSVLMRDQFWKDNAVDGKLNAEAIFRGLQKIYAGFT